MKNWTLVLLASLALSSPLALADRDNRHHRGHHPHQDSHLAFGRVIHAEPVYRTRHRREATQHCWVETQAVEQRRDARGAPLVGGVVGAAIGNRLGRDHHERRISTVAGAIIGAAIASDMSQERRTTHYQDVERCETRYQRQPHRVLIGYDVTYKYRGRTYQTHTREHPGKRIALAVDARPVRY